MSVQANDAPSASACFTVQRLVRFSDCDPAGMVFYPQYFVMLNGLVEDWFTQALGVNYAQFLGARRLGLPLARLQAEFKAPSRMGETIALQLRLARQGRRSLELDVACLGAGNDLRWQANVVIVTTSLDADASINIPQDVVEGIHRWQQSQGEP
ncbi:acyl-CoA thioesterase [Curvibacter sp. APW13]|uniref:acyl-CoA thioesterase n=1 Tax=Curvibacter sp. APW13 TaxID=3077236 RepID=UPI0028E09BB6|nr:acyl-CoA thioesterase [Curvibacter sp. APW13]MDT8992403.1 acyl-CoA thioesterase [Curvibacter sp. APW13]